MGNAPFCVTQGAEDKIASILLAGKAEAKDETHGRLEPKVITAGRVPVSMEQLI